MKIKLAKPLKVKVAKPLKIKLATPKINLTPRSNGLKIKTTPKNTRSKFA